VLQNKDELTVPLSLAQLPTAREFKDAIASLSPEQQRFARAYRAMQLEGCVLGVLVLQLKPQLERLLKLGDGALTKEIKLTQQLLTLFIEHQIPSDLLSYGGGDAAAPEALKLDAVRGHVGAIMGMIEEAKQAELQQRRQEACYDHPLGGIDAEEDELRAELEMSEQSFGSSGKGGGMLRSTFQAQKGGMRRGGARSAPMSASRSVGALPPPPVAAGAPPPPRMAASAAAPPPIRGAVMPVPMGGLEMESSCYGAPPVQAAQRQSAEVYRSSAAQPKSMGSAAPAPAAVPQPQPPSAFDGESVVDAEEVAEMDYTRLPAVLDAKLLAQDADSAVRPTRIDVGEVWTRRAQRALLAKPTSSALGPDEQKQEKEKAFDLLDALSRSGDMPFDCAALHVVVAVTHCFDASLMDTVVVKVRVRVRVS